MSWLQTHEVSIPVYEIREGKHVFAIQVHRRDSSQDVLARNSSSTTSTSSRCTLRPTDNENENMTDSMLGAQITARRSYSQFRKLWRSLTLATKMPSAASLSCSNSTSLTCVERPSICRCRNWNCVFHSFHSFLKSYSFPSKFQIKCSATSALETRRHGLEIFVTSVWKLFDTFPRRFLQSIDGLENCQVLMTLSVFFGITEKQHVNFTMQTTLQLPTTRKEFRKNRCIRPDSLNSESATSFPCSISSRNGGSKCIAWSTNDSDSCSKPETSPTEVESSYAGVDYYLRDGVLVDFTNHKNIDPAFNFFEFQQFPVLLNAKYGKNKIVSTNQTSNKYMASPHRGSSSLTPASRWIQCSRSFDVSLHTAFQAHNPTVATCTSSAIFDIKAPQTLLPGLPQLLRTSEKTSIRSFHEEFKDHLLMDPRALGSSAKPMEDCNEDRQWELALYVASQIGHAYAVEFILRRGPDPNAVMEDGLSSLQAACRGGHRSVVAMLLINGADTNITDANGVSPLLSAVQLGDFDIVDMLVEHGANVNLCNADSVSAVHVAVACQTLPVLRLLLKHDAFVNTKNGFNGKTPLHLAAQCGSLPMCKLLLNHGASIHHKTARGLNVIDLAKSHGHENIARYCLNFESNMEAFQCTSNMTTKATASSSTSECSYNVGIVSDDGYTYAIL